MKALLTFILFGLLTGCVDNRPYADLDALNRAHIAVLDERLAKGEITRAEARLSYLQFARQLDAEEARRRVGEMQDVSTGLGTLGGALKSVGQQQPPVSCVTTGVLTNCY